MKNNISDLTLLYVEDDEMIRKSALMYLNKLCKKVWGASNGLEALSLYEDYKPDIIISDIKMPKLNGLDMAARIRQTDKHTPIILATAFTETSYLLRAVELQLIKYMVKPITAAKLDEALGLAYTYIHQDTQNIISMNENTYYDTLNKTLIIDNEIVKLTKNESLLLDILIKNIHHSVSYKEIENYIWLDKGMSIDTLRSLMRALRHKITPITIENVSGIGYKIDI